MSPDSTRRFRDATAAHVSLLSQFLRIKPKTSNLSQMMTHDPNRPCINSGFGTRGKVFKLVPQ
jgi:hypothetical protein